MEKRMAETRMALEVHVGKHFADVPLDILVAKNIADRVIYILDTGCL